MSQRSDPACDLGCIMVPNIYCFVFLCHSRDWENKQNLRAAVGLFDSERVSPLLLELEGRGLPGKLDPSETCGQKFDFSPGSLLACL